MIISSYINSINRTIDNKNFLGRKLQMFLYHVTLVLLLKVV